MRCQSEREKPARIRYQAACYGIKLESGDLPRFFMIDEIYHLSKSKKKKVVRLSEFVRTWWFFARLSFSEASLPLSCNIRMLKRHDRCHFSSGLGASAPGLRPTSKCTFSLFSSSSGNDQSSREVEQMRQTEVETNYDSSKQTWRSSLATDERRCWSLGLNARWRLRCTSLRNVAAFLFVSSTTKLRLERSWVRQAEMEATYDARAKLVLDEVSLLTNEVI